MNHEDPRKKCKSHFDTDDEVGMQNLTKSLSEQYILKNIEEQKSVVQKLANSCEIDGYSDTQEIYSQSDFGTNFLFFVLVGACRLYIHDNFIAEVNAGECFGEFPILEGGVRYTVTVRSKGESCIAKLSEKDLREIGKKHPGIWMNMSKMLAARLREANKASSFKKPRKKPRIFIGSSTEGLDVARKIQSILSPDFETVIWDQGPFDILGKSYLEILEEVVNQYDYGIFVFTPDDDVESRGESKKSARDNVIFELGMFIGRLSRKRAFLIHPRDLNLKILSDFEGIVKGTYDLNTSNLKAALGPVCDNIRESIKKANIVY